MATPVSDTLEMPLQVDGWLARVSDTCRKRAAVTHGDQTAAEIPAVS
jgi:hypothetical protein